jgi:hypothetical protein
VPVLFNVTIPEEKQDKRLTGCQGTAGDLQLGPQGSAVAPAGTVHGIHDGEGRDGGIQVGCTPCGCSSPTWASGGLRGEIRGGHGPVWRTRSGRRRTASRR